MPWRALYAVWLPLVARRLRATPNGSSMLLVALSGYGHPESRSRAHEVGFDDYLTKPVAPDALARRLAAARASRPAAGASEAG